MKHVAFFLISILVTQTIVTAQEKQYVVKEGTRPRDTFTFSDIYLYPAFTAGKVYFSNKHFGVGTMNYNRFTSEIDFIQEKDTLALADQETMMIKKVIIGKDTFYHQINIGYVQLVAETAYVIFAKKESIQLADRRRHPNSATSSTTSNGTYTTPTNTAAGIASGLALNMIEKVDLIYRKTTEYYFANAKGFFTEADKKNILRLYSGKKAALNLYFEQHEVDFKNEESLRSLFAAITEKH